MLNRSALISDRSSFPNGPSQIQHRQFTDSNLEFLSSTPHNSAHNNLLLFYCWYCWSLFHSTFRINNQQSTINNWLQLNHVRFPRQDLHYHLWGWWMRCVQPLVKKMDCWRWLMVVTRQILHDSAIGTQSMDSRVSGLSQYYIWYLQLTNHRSTVDMTRQ